LKSHRYWIRVKNPSGNYSQKIELNLPKQPSPTPSPTPTPTPTPTQLPLQPPEKCTKSFSKEPHVIYLGGGDAEKLFDRYLSQNCGIGNSLPKEVVIKMYVKDEKGTMAQVPVGLGDMEQLFVESQDDFLAKLKKRLRGKTAEYSPALPNEAAKDHADYFQCCETNP